MQRLDIRLPEGIKDIWKEQSEKMGYKSLTGFISEAVDKFILDNSKKISEIDRDVIIQRQKERMQKKIIYLITRNRSDYFAPSRQIKIFNKIEQQQYFISEEALIKEIRYLVLYANTTKEPIEFLKALIPSIKQKGWYKALDLVKSELLRLGMTEDEIEKFSFPRDSIGYKKNIIEKCDNK